MLATSWLAAACSLIVPCIPAGAPTAPLDDAGYFAVADRLTARLPWDGSAQRYAGDGATTTLINAEALYVHATAALAGHRGPARSDIRARVIVRLITSREVFHEGVHPSWRAAPGRPGAHPVFDVGTVEALAAAYGARRQLGLEAPLVARIRHQIARVARSPDWRWPALRLNQFNWNATMLAADAAVNGRGARLADGLERHIARFAAGPTLGPGLRFNYVPGRWPDADLNFDSPEYANIVLGFARSYGQARAAGMARPASLPVLRAWVRRVIAGYWTHSGYLNWDTGLGFERWHQRKKSALAQGALIGVASEPELQPSARYGAWAKWLLDEGLVSYLELTDRTGQIPPALAYGVDVVPQHRGNAYLAAARYAGNAMRALRVGLGRVRASEPPALYAYDPDTGRVAITTPTYNTAIVAVNHGAFPYGGLDIARLFDARQEVAGSVAGMNRAAFGLAVRVGRRTVLRTQYGRRGWRPGLAPLRVAGVKASATAVRPYAGTFTDLRVHGSVAGGGFTGTSAYRFTPRSINARWTVAGTRGSAVVTFPSWGHGAHIDAVLRDGHVIRLRRTLPLARVRSLRVVSERSGYTITPHGGLRVRLVHPAPQTANPDPGPSVEIALGAAPATFAARLTVG
jgi:hypothetical protein